MSSGSDQDSLLREAVQHHVAGRLDAAEALYRRVLDLNSGHADALNLLGVIAQARGQYEQAQAFYARAVVAGPHVADIHFNFASLLMIKGDAAAGIASYQRALALRPGFVDAQLGLGTALYQTGRFEEAVACFRDVTARAPADARGLINLGLSLLKLDRSADAGDAFMRAIALLPADGEVRMLAAEALAAAGRMDDACAQAREAVALAPRPEYYSALGDLLRRADDLDGALLAHQKALAAKPDDPLVLYNYGASLHAAKRLEDAQVMFARAVAAAPDFVNAYLGLAKVHEHRGLFDEAVATLRTAQVRAPTVADIRFKLAVLQLAAGNLREGWANYAARLEDSKAQHERRAAPPPYWAGEDLSGKSILVWTEQGLGDEILFASMLPDVIARAAHCIIECSPRLAPVLARSFPDAKVVPYQSADVSVTPAHGITYQAAIGDLGRFLRADAAAFPGQRGYLKADMARSQILRARYRALKPGNLIVGISWRSTNADIGALKTAPLSEWGPLLRVPGVTFVNLQYGDCDSDLGDAKARIGVEIFQDVEINPMKSMDDFFAQVAAMDLVISTSNTTVHVAGSMNVPVWLLDAGGLWYWFRQREDSPWYPSLTIFRSHFQWVAGEGQAWWRPGMDGAACRLAMLAGGEKP